MQSNQKANLKDLKKQDIHSIPQYAPVLLKLTRPIDKPITGERIDHWLNKHLGIELNNAQENEFNSTKLRQSTRVISLAAMLLQAGRIPIFERPKVLRVSEEGTNWHAAIRFPWLNGIASPALSLSLKASLNLLEKVEGSELDDSSAQNCYRWLEQVVIPAIAAYAPQGESVFNILKGAYAHGIPFFYLGQGIFSIGTGSKSKLLRKSSLESDSYISSLAAQDKSLTSQILRNAGLPVPNHRAAVSPEEAIQVSKSLQWPLVVKPLNLDRGEGVTINIQTEITLFKAAQHALEINHNKPFLVEEMQKGICHRLVIVHSKLVYVVKRLPIAVVGNGHSTIGELIEEARQSELKLPPWQRSKKKYCDDDLTRETLSQSNLSIESVPNQSETVNLRVIESTAWGGIPEDMTTSTHPDNIRLAIAAAEAMRLGVAGVDIISTDLTVPWHKNNAVVNEVNSSPSIGGGEISRSYLPTFLNYLLGKNPTIPIIQLDKSRTSLKAARGLQASKTQQGIRALIATSSGCIDPNGERMQSTLKSLSEHTHALLLNRNVDCIITLD